MAKPANPLPRGRGLADNAENRTTLADLGAKLCTIAEAAAALERTEDELTEIFEQRPKLRAAFDKAVAEARI